MTIRFASPDQRVFVVDDGRRRSLRLGGRDAPEQALLDVDDPHRVLMGYVRFAALGLAYAPRPRRLLMIGLGGGVYARLMRRLLPGVAIDAVESDPVVVDVARRFLFLEDDPRLFVHVEDGAAFVERTRRRYDLAFLDAYGEGALVPHLSDVPFFEAVRERLRPEGAAIANVAGEDKAERRVAARFAEVFPATDAFRVPDEGNLVLIGRQRPVPEPTLRRRARDLDRRHALGFSLEEMLTWRARMA